MLRLVTVLLSVASAGGLLLAQTPPSTQPPSASDKSGAYYNFAMGRLYAEMAVEQQNKDYVWLKSKDTSKAKTFYEHMGFQICGTSRLDFELMKEEFRGMVTMIKRII